MRFNLFLVATGLASAAIASSYNYARGLDADYPELEERDVFSSKDEATHFLRGLDEDELNALYVRSRKKQLIRPGATANRRPIKHIKNIVAGGGGASRGRRRAAARGRRHAA